MRSDLGWMSRWRNRSTLVGVAAASIVLLAACGGDRSVGVGDGGGGSGGSDGPGGGGSADGDHRYAQVEDELSDLSTGEAKEGLHLRPGIEVLRVDFPSTNYKVEIDAESEEDITVNLVGEARDQVLEADEIWTDDILLGHDFIFLVSDLEDDNAQLTLEVEPFQLEHVVHGDWSIDFGVVPEGDLNLVQAADPNAKIEVPLDELIDEAWKGASISGAGSIKPDVRGTMEFPVDWDARFEGRISVANRGLNPDYECEPVERRKFRLRGGFRIEKEEPRFFCMEYLLIKGVVGMDYDLIAEFEATGHVEAKAEHKITLGSVLGPATIPGTGLGLYFEPFFKQGTQVLLEAAGKLDVDANGTIRVPLGMEYDHHEGVSPLPNDNHPVEYGDDNKFEPELSGEELKATLRNYSQVGIGLFLSDTISHKGARLAGPGVGVELGQEVIARTNPEMCIKGAAYLRAFATPEIRGELKVPWLLTDRSITFVTADDYEIRHNFIEFPEVDDVDYADICTDEYPVVPTDPEDPTELVNRLTWSEPTELDLVLTTPNGNTFRYDATNHDGGVYDPVQVTDACLEDNAQCEEVIYWDESYLGYAPPEGEYEVYVDNWNSSGESASYELEIEADGERLPASHSGQLAPGESSNPVTYTIR